MKRARRGGAPRGELSKWPRAALLKVIRDLGEQVVGASRDWNECLRHYQGERARLRVAMAVLKKIGSGTGGRWEGGMARRTLLRLRAMRVPKVARKRRGVGRKP